MGKQKQTLPPIGQRNFVQRVRGFFDPSHPMNQPGPGELALNAVLSKDYRPLQSPQPGLRVRPTEQRMTRQPGASMQAPTGYVGKPAYPAPTATPYSGSPMQAPRGLAPPTAPQPIPQGAPMSQPTTSSMPSRPTYANTTGGQRLLSALRAAPNYGIAQAPAAAPASPAPQAKSVPSVQDMLGATGEAFQDMMRARAGLGTVAEARAAMAPQRPQAQAPTITRFAGATPSINAPERQRKYAPDQAFFGSRPVESGFTETLASAGADVAPRSTLSITDPQKYAAYQQRRGLALADRADRVAERGLAKGKLREALAESRRTGMPVGGGEGGSQLRGYLTQVMMGASNPEMAAKASEVLANMDKTATESEDRRLGREQATNLAEIGIKPQMLQAEIAGKSEQRQQEYAAKKLELDQKVATGEMTKQQAELELAQAQARVYSQMNPNAEQNYTRATNYYSQAIASGASPAEALRGAQSIDPTYMAYAPRQPSPRPAPRQPGAPSISGGLSRYEPTIGFWETPWNTAPGARYYGTRGQGNIIRGGGRAQSIKDMLRSGVITPEEATQLTLRQALK